MRAIRPGDRGPAVEDVQRRLRSLGYDLGRTGVDGVFQGMTLGAVEAFQNEHGLDEDGLVGDVTWAALVDATFTLGDRMLYLRLPHLHGRDVRELQDALNVLGFTAGDTDGIFGTFTERAVREFQRNTGLPADGIAGGETVRALSNLRHVWEGKESGPHTAARKGPARAAEVLARNAVALRPSGAFARDVAGRVINLALASTQDARVILLSEDAEPPADAKTVVRLVPEGQNDLPGLPIVHLDGADDPARVRIVTAIEVSSAGCSEVLVELDGPGDDPEHSAQRAAVAILDALCAALD